jgi:hypothetical protein
MYVSLTLPMLKAIISYCLLTLALEDGKGLMTFNTINELMKFRKKTCPSKLK